MTKADKLGIIASIAITIIFVGISAGGTPLEKTISQDFSSIEQTLSQDLYDLEKEVDKTKKDVLEFEKAKGELEDFEEQVFEETTRIVRITKGSSMPGCEQTNECYNPSNIRIFEGQEVTWINDDAAAHTVTSGIVRDGPDGKFDSSLFLSGKKFSAKFEDAGEYPYFCMVHPWMAGSVTVL